MSTVVQFVSSQRQGGMYFASGPTEIPYILDET